jgi:hypothetical protein
MAYNNSSVKEITAKLESGIKELFESDKYAEYLRTMSRFHNYSTRNILLIHAQLPEASHVAGYSKWRDEFKRYPMKGTHGIKIFAPAPFVIKEEKEKIDPVTSRPILDEHGMPVTEEIEKRLARFKLVTVFDVSQTAGEPLPELSETLIGNVQNYELFIEALRAVSPLPIEFVPLNGLDGRCIYGDKIQINDNMSEIQTVLAIIHEMTHEKLHNLDNLVVDDDEQPKRKDSRTQEVESESVAFTVCNAFGIETGANSFGYVANWSKTQELKELYASLDIIKVTSKELIDSIGKKYQELAKENGIDITAETATPEQSPVQAVPAAPLFVETHAIGENVFMPMLFNSDGNLERTAKRTRVKVEPPIGKYQIYSHLEGTAPYATNHAYMQTDSGKLIYLTDMERLQNTTEADLDNFCNRARENFTAQFEDTGNWVDYKAAAIVNRIAGAEIHNAPVKAAREVKSRAENEARLEVEKIEEAEREQVFNNRIDEIATAIYNGTTISVGYNENEYDGKNPVLNLFRLYNINVPLRTQGWINTGLAEINDDGYRYYSGNNKGNSSTFSTYLEKLRFAIKETPIEQKRAYELAATAVFVEPTPSSNASKTVAERNYDRFAQMFPQIASGEFRYLHLESTGFEPLSVQWVDENKISMMQTYTMNGDLMFDPMIDFEIDAEAGTMNAIAFEQSMPPMYQFPDESGQWHSVDGNGRDTIMQNLQAEINTFTTQWLTNISEQGHIPVRGIIEIDGNDTEITFDADGETIVPESTRGDFSFSDVYVTERDSLNAKGVMTQEQYFDMLKERDVTGEMTIVQAAEMYKQYRADTELADAIISPDPTLTLADMNTYGYTEEGMLPLSNLRAVELFDSGEPIYLLYPDGTEEMVFDTDEIKAHNGLCGIELDEWETTLKYSAQTNTIPPTANYSEADLLFGDTNMYGIYQVKNGEEFRPYRFLPSAELYQQGLEIERDNYNLLYTAPLLDSATKEGIFALFNLNIPDEFTGHSLSMGDIIVFQRENIVNSYYLDRGGYTELSAFIGGEAQNAGSLSLTGTSTETAAPTVDKFLANANAGGSIKISDLAKATNNINQPPKVKVPLLTQLETNKRKVTRQTISAPHKTNTQEVS